MEVRFIEHTLLSEVSPLRGVQYVVDENKAVVLDLRAWGRLWEDFQDVLVAEARQKEPGVPWETLRAEMKREGRRTGRGEEVACASAV